MKPVFTSVLALMLPLVAHTVEAQRGRDPMRHAIEVQPSSLILEVGETATLTATVRDASGQAVDAPVVFTSLSRRNVGVSRVGVVEAYGPGEFTLRVVTPGEGGRPGARADVAVTVRKPPLARIEVTGIPGRLYKGAAVWGNVAVYDVSGALRRDEGVTLTSTDPSVVEVNEFVQITPVGAGVAALRIAAGDVVEEISVRVEENPVVSLELTSGPSIARTGDVIHFEPVAKDGAGRTVEDFPVSYSVQAHPVADNPASSASGQVAADGRFVAELPGRYTIIAHAGNLVATATVEVELRDVQRRVQVVGRGPVRDRHTSDLWIWSGPDGRDYAVTGTWGSSGEAYFWDVTDPSEIQRIGVVQVDARTVNDVKVSEDGTVAVISREGASDRRNGVVILDVTDPAAVEILAEFDQGLTGGVHNVFIYEEHLYAVNNGRSYDVIDISEPKLPFQVSRFELGQPGHSVHDVWVEDGIAYSSNWRDGVVLVDVGNGIAGGTPETPVQFAAYADPQGRTHAAFPFLSESTGRFYVITGDEIFPFGLDSEGPTISSGYMHIVDFTDFQNPVEVARYEVPETGSHNLWIENDTLYAAFYNGGLRVVDLSGELMGDLYKQGREIARFRPNDKLGFVQNESMTWGVQPHKGFIYISDWNSGLWAVRLLDAEGTGDQ